eukprot:TRINITY_DN10442_c0_g1_i1.p1 TRINITY_DN10442_c0_g1~~TRINITY_DN10442_c0_g1_i1.p1  ORF type:complete len:595 (-),score=136.72 TRINITY_DN10442_c0_g1_i1:593-2275(-)
MSENEPLLPVTQLSRTPSKPESRPLLQSRVSSKAGRKAFSKIGSKSKFMVEKTPDDPDALPHRLDYLKIEKEAVIQATKPILVEGLCSLLDPKEAVEFKLLIDRVHSAIRAWYKTLFEELMALYQVFDPQDGQEKLQEVRMSVAEIEEREVKFLRLLFHIMDKSNYKMMTDKEYNIALDGSYLLSLPIKVDKTKLESGLFSRFFAEYHQKEKPSFGEQYITFRRGVGIDQVTQMFYLEKVDMILTWMWDCCLWLVCLKKRTSWEPRVNDTRGPDDSQDPAHVLLVERIHLEQMKLSCKFLTTMTTIQEPTFERIILLYRPATPPDFQEAHEDTAEPLGDRTIYIKHFRHIPMADMEIVLPEKLTPGLTPRDWISFAMTLIFGVIAIITAITSQAGTQVYIGIGVACGTYITKLYLAWQASMRTYAALIQQSMYDKQLDSGKGTLLHLCDDVLQQELKEVAVSFFILATTGPASKEELDKRCEMFMERKFLENVQFDVEDAVEKLLRLGLARLEPDGKYYNTPLKKAASTIGPTTDELYGSTEGLGEISKILSSSFRSDSG